MLKFYLTIVVATQIIGLSYGLVTDIIALGVNITEDFQAIRIGTLGEVGYIAVPFNTLCRVPAVDEVLVCGVCNQDCIFAHNAYGGNCVPNPLIEGELTCLCAYTVEDAVAMGVSINTRTTCGSDIVPPPVTYLQDTIFKPAIIIRSRALHCAVFGETTVACYTDCSSNHGLLGGTCRTAFPRAPGSGLLPTHYCECI